MIHLVFAIAELVDEQAVFRAAKHFHPVLQNVKNMNSGGPEIYLRYQTMIPALEGDDYNHVWVEVVFKFNHGTTCWGALFSRGLPTAGPKINALR